MELTGKEAARWEYTFEEALRAHPWELPPPSLAPDLLPGIPHRVSDHAD